MEDTRESNKIELSRETLKVLNATRKWTMFLAVAGFIFLGLIIAAGTITGAFLAAFSRNPFTSGIPDYLIIGLFILASVINFLPILYLYRFSKHTAAAVSSPDEKELLKAFRNLKRLAAYFGILLIIIVLIYITSLVLISTSFQFPEGI